MSADDALARAIRSLDGLSVGDAFGDRFVDSAGVVAHLSSRELPEAPWRYTDDTEMALSLVEALAQRGTIDSDVLARAFAERMDLTRGYGRGAFEVLSAILDGIPWSSASQRAFRGMGSFGNGAAMRVAPLGAFFADDFDRCVEEAVRSAEVTHAHEEGIAGAIAVAVATALTWRHREKPLSPDVFFAEVSARCPARYVREGIEEARSLPLGTDLVDVAKALGNGTGVSAPDTVPFCLWVVAHVDHSATRAPEERFAEAMWTTVSALGDRDTTCAIVGGILGVTHAPPPEWLARRETLPPMNAHDLTSST